MLVSSALSPNVRQCTSQTCVGLHSNCEVLLKLDQFNQTQQYKNVL